MEGKVHARAVKGGQRHHGGVGMNCTNCECCIPGGVIEVTPNGRCRECGKKVAYVCNDIVEKKVTETGKTGENLWVKIIGSWLVIMLLVGILINFGKRITALEQAHHACEDVVYEPTVLGESE